ncbi:MAG: phosphatidylglycerophosphatase A [Alphaproteobacteria bacterium]|nr:phosphatidylglycerophosphatase A [Alphaproteobacteria bacterium]
MRRLPPTLAPSHPAAWLATWFYSGLLPIAPGSWGSLAALPFAWAIAAWLHPWALVPAAAVALLVGLWAAAVYIRHDGSADPGPVVIDEVAGQWLTLAFVPPHPLAYALGFVLFRVADIVKPWPIGWIDRNLRGSLGVMLDDVLAGVYAAIALWVCLLLLRSLGLF